MQLEIPKCLGDDPKASTYKVTINMLSCWVVFTQNHGFVGHGEECRKHWGKEEKRQKKNTEKWRGGKTKNTRKVK